MKLILRNCNIEFARNYTVEPSNIKNGFFSMDGEIIGDESHGQVFIFDVRNYNKVRIEMAIPTNISSANRSTIWTTMREGVRQSLYSFSEGATNTSSINMEIDTSTCDELIVNKWAGLSAPTVNYVPDNTQWIWIEGSIKQGYYNASMEFKENQGFNCGEFDVSQYNQVTIIAAGNNDNGISMYIGKKGDTVVIRELQFRPDPENSRTTSLVVDTKNLDTLIVQSLKRIIPTVKAQIQ